MLKNPQNHDAEKVIAVSQNIIYHFILIEVNAPEDKRYILIDNDEILKGLTETIKICLNPKNLHNKGVSAATLKQSANSYRIAIEVLQITNLSLGALKGILSEPYRNGMLLTVWGLLRIEDKIIKYYSFVWTSNYIRTFDGFDPNKALGLYLTLIRGLESLSQGDYEIGALIKKALNILIPYWDTKARGTNSWIEWSLKAVQE
jgi:hypothetical protein